MYSYQNSLCPIPSGSLNNIHFLQLTNCVETNLIRKNLSRHIKNLGLPQVVTRSLMHFQREAMTANGIMLVLLVISLAISGQAQFNGNAGKIIFVSLLMN